jgi:C1A family cysteine protease/PKD repeat protein
VKRISVLLLASLVIQGILAQTAPWGAPLNPDYIQYLQDLQNGLVTNVTADGHGLGYIPGRVKPDFSGYVAPNAPSTFPSVYDLRLTGKMTSVKDQGSCGSCWCFATMATIESRWKVLGLGDNDLSENNLKNCHLYDWGPCDGGNIEIASAYLSRREGPVPEAFDPYSPTAQSCLTGLTPVAWETSACFLPNDITAIKQTLMDYGAVYTAFYWGDAYYNSYDYTYYYTGSAGSNHAVTIAGWDDTKATAGGTGAWIIKNSWGSYWGDGGYFYISYNDNRINAEAGYFPARMAYAGNTKIYHYDDFGMIESYGWGTTVGYGLVKFVATNTWPVTKIGTWINASIASYDIEVYDNFDGTTLSGLLGSLPNQSSPYPGYYLFDLPGPISMTTGNDFYVKIKYTTPGYYYPVPIEEIYPGYASNVTIETGVCWWSTNGTSWSAIGGGTSYPYDLCIKAYASQPSDNLPPVVDFTAGNVTPSPNETVYFTDISSNNPASWQWSFSPGSITYADGTTSASQNPHIKFTSPGSYSVTLQATNAYGTGTLTKSGYITVPLQPSTGWTEQASGFATQSRGITDLFCVNSSVVWAAAYDGANPNGPCIDFTRTLNGGTLWTPGTITGATGLCIANICAIDGNTAWVCMYNPGSATTPHGIYKTVNGGAAWGRQASATFSNASSFPDCVYFWDANNGWCMGDPANNEFEIYTTTNGGTTWSPVPGTQIPDPLYGEFGIVGYYSVAGNSVWFGTNEGRIYRSTDKGYNWTVSQIPGWSGIYVQPFFKNEYYGVAMDKSYTSTYGNLVRSFDGGVTWTAITPPTSGNFTYDMAFIPGSTGTCVVTGADAINNLMGARYSFDNGLTWNDMPSTIGTQFLATGWINDSTGWAGGFNVDATTGGMYKFNGHLAPPPVYWTGTADGNWNNTNNWYPAIVPSTPDNVIIPGNAPQMPVITAQGYACHDLTILTGATVTVSPGIILTISGRVVIDQ